MPPKEIKIEREAFPWWMPDPRGWIAIGSFALAVMVIVIMKEDQTIRNDEFFQTIATIVIANGWLSVVAWGFSATKGGGEQAASNAVIAEKLATALPQEPQPVVVANTAEQPVPTTNGDEELPPYAQP